ncbi:hypothetical protein B0H14DRAFT_2581128 [Mycena olivaceomarginata]|nr:hypothetical protein B0H14DRAFT_2581128 [Mycena olivaceomarginata]
MCMLTTSSQEHMQYTVHPQCRTNCVGWHEILNGVSLLLTCVGFERCVAVSGFREPLFEARYAHDVLTVRGEVRCEAVRTRTGVGQLSAVLHLDGIDRREECSSGVREQRRGLSLAALSATVTRGSSSTPGTDLTSWYKGSLRWLVTTVGVPPLELRANPLLVVVALWSELCAPL